MHKDPNIKFLRPTPEQQREIEERAKWVEAFDAARVKYADGRQMIFTFQEGS